MLVCGVRWGKSLSAAMEGIAAALLPSERSFGWVVAPTHELADKIFREIVVIVSIQHARAATPDWSTQRSWTPVTGRTTRSMTVGRQKIVRGRGCVGKALDFLLGWAAPGTAGTAGGVS